MSQFICLENLSNEIIYEIFDYLSFHNIASGFKNLNKRFQELTDNYSHYVNLQQYKIDDVQPLPRHIHSLKINARYQLEFIRFSNILSIRGLLISNLTAPYLTNICENIPLNDLEYVYLSGCGNYWLIDEQDQILEIQRKVLGLAEKKLRKCVFRSRLLVNVDELPTDLPSLEYLRIDGCKDLTTIVKLLQRMPNLKSLYISICESTESTKKNILSIEKNKNNKNHNLKSLIIRIYSDDYLDEFPLLFSNYCSNLIKLIIYLKPIKDKDLQYKLPGCLFTNLKEWVTTTICPVLPKLQNFHIRQLVLSTDADRLNSYCSYPPYVEEIPCSNIYKSCRISIPQHLVTIWKN